jgi:antitoxin (DNA-binding transcriptional repressor) of toxin-antitoxin stability system
MPTYDLDYAQEHLPELFHQARMGEEVIIMRDDGRSCELTPLAEVRNDELSSNVVEIPTAPEDSPGEPVPA